MSDEAMMWQKEYQKAQAAASEARAELSETLDMYWLLVRDVQEVADLLPDEYTGETVSRIKRFVEKALEDGA